MTTTHTHTHKENDVLILFILRFILLFWQKKGLCAVCFFLIKCCSVFSAGSNHILFILYTHFPPPLIQVTAAKHILLVTTDTLKKKKPTKFKPWVYIKVLFMRTTRLDTFMTYLISIQCPQHFFLPSDVAAFGTVVQVTLTYDAICTAWSENFSLCVCPVFLRFPPPPSTPTSNDFWLKNRQTLNHALQ